VCLTPAEVDLILAGEHLTKIDPLFLVQCSCSNKCSVVVNHPASHSTLNALERSDWGAHLVEGKTTALGLLLYGKYTRTHQGWTPVEELIGTQAINPKAMSKANHRLALFATPAHSVVQRSLANNCFILSLNIYQRHTLALLRTTSIYTNNALLNLSLADHGWPHGISHTYFGG